MLSITTLSTFAVGLAIGFILRSRWYLINKVLFGSKSNVKSALKESPKSSNKSNDDVIYKIDIKNRKNIINISIFKNDTVFADSGEIKLVLVVRNDLKMGKGKAAAQVIYSIKNKI